MRTFLVILSLAVVAIGVRAEELQITMDFSQPGLRVFRVRQNAPAGPRAGAMFSIESGAVPAKLLPYVSIFKEACRRNGLRENLFLAIALQENVNPTYLNPLGLSNDNGVFRFRSFLEAQAAIEHQAELIVNPKGPYCGVRTIQDLAAVYSPVGAVNDLNGTNATEAAGILENLKKLGSQ